MADAWINTQERQPSKSGWYRARCPQYSGGKTLVFYFNGATWRDIEGHEVIFGHALRKGDEWSEAPIEAPTTEQYREGRKAGLLEAATVLDGIATQLRVEAAGKGDEISDGKRTAARYLDNASVLLRSKVP